MTMIYRVAPRSGVGIDQESASLLMQCQPECLNANFPQRVDVEAMFEFDIERLTGFTTGFCDFPEGLEGCTDVTSKTCNVSTSLCHPRSRQFLRSTIGHEIGHVWLHTAQMIAARKTVIFKDSAVSLSLPRQSDQIIPTPENCEWQAHRFSGGLLMPTNVVIACVQRGLSIREMSQIFDVSIPFVRSRLKGLGLLDVVRAF